MESSNTAAAQAELMEKEKVIVETQQRLQMLRDTLKTLASRQVVLHREKRRSDVTVKELSKLEPNHVIYKSVGRAFAKVQVAKLVDEHQENAERTEAEDQRLGAEKMRLAESIKKEEAQLRQAITEFQTVVQILQAAQPRSAATA